MPRSSAQHIKNKNVFIITKATAPKDRLALLVMTLSRKAPKYFFVD